MRYIKRTPRTDQSSKGGFTLIEALVAVLLLSLGLSGVVGLTTASLRDLGIQREKMLATKIAAEGMEFMLNKRDNNTRCMQSPTCTLDCGEDWRAGIANEAGTSCNFGNQDACWEVNAARPDQLLANASFSQLTTGACNVLATSDYLCIETTGIDRGKYTYCGNDPAKMIPQQFTRIMKVSEIPGSTDKVRVEAVVRWQSQLIGSQEIRLEEIIFGR